MSTWLPLIQAQEGWPAKWHEGSEAEGLALIQTAPWPAQENHAGFADGTQVMAKALPCAAWVRALLERGLSPNYEWGGDLQKRQNVGRWLLYNAPHQTAWQHAVDQGYVDVAKILVEHGAVVPENWLTEVLLAPRGSLSQPQWHNKTDRLVQSLKSLGDRTSAPKWQETALQVLRHHKSFASLVALARLGGDRIDWNASLREIDPDNSRGGGLSHETPLSAVLNQSCPASVEWLLQQGGKRWPHGWTLLELVLGRWAESSKPWEWGKSLNVLHLLERYDMVDAPPTIQAGARVVDQPRAPLNRHPVSHERWSLACLAWQERVHPVAWAQAVQDVLDRPAAATDETSDEVRRLQSFLQALPACIDWEIEPPHREKHDVSATMLVLQHVLAWNADPEKGPNASATTAIVGQGALLTLFCHKIKEEINPAGWCATFLEMALPVPRLIPVLMGALPPFLQNRVVYDLVSLEGRLENHEALFKQLLACVDLPPVFDEASTIEFGKTIRIGSRAAGRSLVQHAIEQKAPISALVALEAGFSSATSGPCTLLEQVRQVMDELDPNTLQGRARAHQRQDWKALAAWLERQELSQNAVIAASSKFEAGRPRL